MHATLPNTAKGTKAITQDRTTSRLPKASELKLSAVFRFSASRERAATPERDRDQDDADDLVLDERPEQARGDVVEELRHHVAVNLGGTLGASEVRVAPGANHVRRDQADQRRPPGC